MANHTDDCPHCGVDRRGLVRDHCCDMARAEDTARRVEYRARQQERRELLTRLGIEVRDREAFLLIGEREVVPEMESLFAFLRSFS